MGSVSAWKAKRGFPRPPGAGTFVDPLDPADAARRGATRS